MVDPPKTQRIINSNEDSCGWSTCWHWCDKGTTQNMTKSKNTSLKENKPKQKRKSSEREESHHHHPYGQTANQWTRFFCDKNLNLLSILMANTSHNQMSYFTKYKTKVRLSIQMFFMVLFFVFSGSSLSFFFCHAAQKCIPTCASKRGFIPTAGW